VVILDYIIGINSEVSHCIFKDNTAVYEGAGVQYRSKEPTMLNNSFTGNQASYGGNVASYPVGLLRRSTAGVRLLQDTNTSSLSQTASG
jgi:hypothetical protein